MSRSLDRIDYGIDTKNRSISFGCVDYSDSFDVGADFTWLSVELAVRSLKLLESENNKPIELHMSSPGGDAFAMLRLYDHIQRSPCQIKFFGSGIIASSATWIMAGCDERYLDKHTWVLLHDSPSTGDRISPMKLTDYEIDVGLEKGLQDQLNEMYAKNSRMPKSFYDELVRRDLWLNAEETVALGLADQVIEPKKRGNVRKIRNASLKQKVDPSEMTRLIKRLRTRVHLPDSLHIAINQVDDESDPSITVPE